MKYRKSLLAVTCALPLILTACGKDDGESADGTHSSAADSSAAASSENNSSDKSKPSEGKEDGEKGDKASESNKAPKPDEARRDSEGGRPSADGKRNDNDGGGTPGRDRRNGEPRGAGHGAPPAAGGNDSQQITALVQGMSKQRSAYDFLNYSLAHSCRAYINSQGGEKTIRSNNDAIKAMGPEGNKAIPVPAVKSVDNIKVNGDRATATVTASYANKAPQTEPMSFARENGKWTLCPS